MKTPRFRHGRLNRLLVQLSASIRGSSHLALIAGEHCISWRRLRVADGLVSGQCHPRQRFVDFRSFLETVVEACAQRRSVQAIALVLDTGPTHASKQLPRWVEELARASEGKLTMPLSWLPTNASWLDQIEIW